jgi:hypothetical protein
VAAATRFYGESGAPKARLMSWPVRGNSLCCSPKQAIEYSRIWYRSIPWKETGSKSSSNQGGSVSNTCLVCAEFTGGPGYGLSRNIMKI